MTENDACTGVLQASPHLRFKRFQSEIEAAIKRVFGRGQFLLGPETVQFETEFANYLDASHCVTVSSGTDAIAIALRAVGVKPGDVVLTVALTAAGTAVGIRRADAQPRFVDVSRQTRCMDPAALEEAICPRTTAIVPVHLHGHPAPMTEIMAIAAKRRLLVVEDCAQAHGARFGGRRLGTFGDAAAFSFYPTKNLGCAGDGGAVVTSDPIVFERAMAAREYGALPGKLCSVEGYNGRMDELQCAILRVLLPHLDTANRERRAAAGNYQSLLAKRGAVQSLPHFEESSHHQFVLETANRDAVRTALKRSPIGTGIHYTPGLHRHPVFCDDKTHLPETDRLASRMISLPIQPEIVATQIGTICRQLERILEHA